MDEVVRRKLSEARSRLVIQSWLGFIVLGWLLCLSLLAILWAAASLLSFRLDFPLTLAAAILLPPILGLLGAIAAWNSRQRVAGELDRAASSKDRFTTALAVPSGIFSEPALREIAAYAQNLRVENAIRFKTPPHAAWLAIPVFVLCALFAWDKWSDALLAPDREKARTLVGEAEKLAAKHKDPEVDKAREELEQTAKAIENSKNPMKDAMEALSDMERKMAASLADAADSSMTPEEAQALADSLAANNARLSDSLQRGQFSEAEKELREMDPEALAKALEDAAKHVESSRLRDLLRQGARQAKQQLGSMMTSSSASGSQGARRRFLSSLQDLKNGGTQSGEAGSNGNQEGMDTGDGKSQEKSVSEGEKPGAAPGSELDIGEGADIAGRSQVPAIQAGAEDFIQGLAGDGQSLVETFRLTGNDDAKARRAFRQAYEQAAPAALDAVEQENIPIGSRIMVRKYFEAIRPAE